MIRINSNPFAAEYSESGFARIEIITKPGTSTYHGNLRLNFNDESLNARNSFAPYRAPLQIRNYSILFQSLSETKRPRCKTARVQVPA